MATKRNPTPATVGAPTPGTPMDFVYAGQRQTADGSVGISVYLLGSPAKGVRTLGDERIFKTSAAAAKRKVIGGIYTGAHFEERVAYGVTGAKWTGERWRIEEDIIRWTALDTACELEIKYEKLRKDANRVNAIEKIMEPLRAQFHGMMNRGDIEGARALRVAVEVALTKKV